MTSQRSREHGRRTASPSFLRRGRTRSLLAGGVAVGLALASVGGGTAFAAADDRAEAEGVLVSGEGIVDLDTIASLNGAYSDFPAGGVETEAIDLTALGALNVQVGAGVLPLNQLIDLGVVDQYAETGATGAIASAGAIGGDGAIAVGGAGPASDTAVTLAPLLDALGLEDVVSDLSVELGALAARAEATRTTAGADIASDYEVAGGTMSFEAPAVATLLDALEAPLDATSDAVDGTVGELDDLLQDLVDVIDDLGAVSVGTSDTTVDLDLDLTTVIDAIRDEGPLTEGAVTVDFNTGTVTVDLDSLVDGGLNGNTSGTPTEVISSAGLSAIVSDAIVDILDTALPAAIEQVLNTTQLELGVETTLLLGLGSADITIAGSLGSFLGNEGQPAPVVTPDITLIGLPVGTILTPVTTFVTNTLLPTVTSTLATALDLEGLTSDLDAVLTTALTTLGPVFDLLANIVSLQFGTVTTGTDFQDANGLDGTGYTRQAVRLALADGAGGGLLTLNLASATVRGEALAAPAELAITPERGPVTGGTPVTITGDNLDDVTEILFGTVPVEDFTVNDDGSISTNAPEQAEPGLVTVSVTNPDGTDSSLGFEYFNVASVETIDPNSGSTLGGDDVTITGECLTATTAVLFGGEPGTGLTVVSDTEVTVTTPPGTAGTVDVTVETSDADCGEVTVPDGYTYVEPGAPVISDIDPGEGPETGGTTVTITGTDFSGTESVTFDGVDATDFTVVSDTEIEAVTPPGTPGVVGVVVTNGTGESAAFDFEYIDVAGIDEVDPGSGPEAGGTEVTITGDCFVDVTDVLFGGASATSFTVVSDTEITAVAPAGTGTVDITVETSGTCGTVTEEDAFEYIAPPTIEDLTPVEGPETGGTTVTITGEGFTGATGVTFGDEAGVEFEVVSDTEISVQTPPGAPGVVPVTVQHPGGDTVAGDFEYLNVPTVTDLDPATGPEDGGTVVTITGEGFTGATGVTFDGDAGTAFSVVSDTEITVTTPPHAAGPVDVVVLHPVADAAAGEFTYVTGTEIDGVDPGEGPAGGGNEVTITGECFTGATDVLFGDASATSFTVVSDTEITAVAPAGTGTVDVTVIGSDACGDDTVDDAYEYIAPPTIDDLDPTSGPETGGTVVTITGEGFTGATGVTFGDEPGVDFEVVSDTEITVTTPGGEPGVVTVTVQHPGGDTDAGEFEYLNVPSVTDLEPAQGPEDGGTVVTITGEGFTGATGATFDGLAGVEFTVVSDTEITVTTPPHAAGPVDVVVLHPNGDSEPGEFTYVTGTEIDGVDPEQGPEDGGNEVTITGECFTGATDVLFGDVSATSFTVVSDTEITAVAPAGTGTVDVTVIGSDACGDDTIDDGYEYLAPPTVDDLTPGEGPETGGTVVTITGEGFTDATGVTFGGEPGTEFTVVDDTTITVETPPGAPGVVEVVVQHPGGDVDAGDFEYLDVPSISGLDPVQGPEDGGTVVTVTGEGFTGATGVTFDGAPGTAFTIVSDTEITVTTPAHAPGAVDVIVLHPNGDSESGEFTYVAGTEIDDVTPPGGPEEGGNEVTIIGECFTGATDVRFGDVSATSFTVVSDTEIVAVAPAGTGTVDVTVVGSEACGTETLPDGYEYTDLPVIGTISPTEGPETGGTVVTITGSNFDDVTGVMFDLVSGTDLEIVSETELVITSPPGTVGVADLVVMNAAGSSDPGEFTYLPVGAGPGGGDNDPGDGDGGPGDGGTLPESGGDSGALGVVALAALAFIVAGLATLLRRRRLS